jgi:hypothetical protein
MSQCNVFLCAVSVHQSQDEKHGSRNMCNVLWYIHVTEQKCELAQEHTV